MCIRDSTRVVWMLLAPISLLVAPLFGAHLYHRLKYAPGLEDQFKVMDVHIFAFLFCMFCIVWLIPGFVGWQLRRPGEKRIGRSADLRELFVMTAIVSVMLILFRGAFDFQSLSAGAQAPTLQLLSIFAIRHFVVYGLCIWTGLTFHWSVCLLVACFAVGVESYFAMYSQRIQITGFPPRPFWNYAERHIWNAGIVLALVAAIRVAGYRIQRTPNFEGRPLTTTPSGAREGRDLSSGEGEKAS